jgi:hypothetical protein
MSKTATNTLTKLEQFVWDNRDRLDRLATELNRSYRGIMVAFGRAERKMKAATPPPSKPLVEVLAAETSTALYHCDECGRDSIRSGQCEWCGSDLKEKVKVTIHTPGHWRISWESNGAFIYDGEPKNNRPAIAHVYGAYRGLPELADEAIANARLIAAAPKLLAMLKACADHLDEVHSDEKASGHFGDGQSCSYCEAIEDARRIIAMVEGGDK